MTYNVSSGTLNPTQSINLTLTKKDFSANFCTLHGLLVHEVQRVVNRIGTACNYLDVVVWWKL